MRIGAVGATRRVSITRTLITNWRTGSHLFDRRLGPLTRRPSSSPTSSASASLRRPASSPRCCRAARRFSASGRSAARSRSREPSRYRARRASTERARIPSTCRGVQRSRRVSPPAGLRSSPGFWQAIAAGGSGCGLPRPARARSERAPIASWQAGPFSQPVDPRARGDRRDRDPRAVQMRGVGPGRVLQNLLTALKVAALVAFVAIGFHRRDEQRPSCRRAPPCS